MKISRLTVVIAASFLVGLLSTRPSANGAEPAKQDATKPAAAAPEPKAGKSDAKPQEKDKKAKRAKKKASDAGPTSPTVSKPDIADAPVFIPKKADAPKPLGKTAGNEKSAVKSAEKKLSVVRLAIKGEYSEGPSQGGLLSEIQPSLASMIQKLHETAGDKSVSAVWLRVEDLEVGRGKIYELRAAIGRLRKAGKPVYAELTSADTGQYLLAAACDEIFMPPSGMLIVPGVRAEVTFYKGLLDKVGLEFDALQMGKYKGAVEPFTRTSLSGPLRESLEAVVEDTYEDMVGTIVKDRRLKDYAVKTLLDQGLFTAAAAQRAGLIDRVCYADEFHDWLRGKLGADQIEVVTNYKKKQVDTDFSGVSGFMKLMEMFSGKKPAEKSGTKQKIAVVYAVGPIIEGKSVTDMFGDSAIGSTSMVEAIRKAADDPKVVAIVLRVDSPGGSAVASDLIWRETVKCKKPLIASMGDVAGSGGYYIAMAVRKIFAEPGTITGSIGVVGGKLVTRGLYDKIGLSTEVVSRGKNSGSLSSNEKFTDDERRSWTEMLTETYNQFVAKAAQGRKMNRDRLEGLAQGRIYTGRMAKKIGLIDEIGTLQDAIAEAKKAGGLKPDADVDLLILPRPKSVFEQIFGDGAITPDFESAMPEMFKTLRQTKLLRQLLGERVLLWMPYGVKVR